MRACDPSTRPGARLAAPARAARYSGTARARGAALLMALMVVTLVATMAASVLWQQWRSIQVEAAERGRAQAEWVLEGALDFARLMVREDSRTGGPDGLGEQWATRLKPARLTTFLAADRTTSDDVPEAFLSGWIDDAQSRYNLRNLQATDKVLEEELRILARLCDAAGLPPGSADRLAAGVKAALRAVAPPVAASAPQGGSGVTAGAQADEAGSPLLPEVIDQLGWLGLPGEQVRALRRVVTLLPQPTPVNVNTAPREVLAAVLNVDLATAERIVQSRTRQKDQAYKTLEDMRSALPGSTLTLNTQRMAVSSRFFEAVGALDLGERAFARYWLIERRGLDVFAIAQRRIDAVEAAAIAEGLLADTAALNSLRP